MTEVFTKPLDIYIGAALTQYFDDPTIYTTIGEDGHEGACFESVERLLEKFSDSGGDLSHLYVGILSFQLPGKSGPSFTVNTTVLRPEVQASIDQKGWEYHAIILGKNKKVYDLFLPIQFSNEKDNNRSHEGIDFAEYISLLNPKPFSNKDTITSPLYLITYSAQDIVYAPLQPLEGLVQAIEY